MGLPFMSHSAVGGGQSGVGTREATQKDASGPRRRLIDCAGAIRRARGRDSFG